MIHNSRSRGFTLIELLIVVLILIIVSVAGFIYATNYRNKQNLVDATNQVLAVVHEAQNRSISQQSGLRWGVHFSNASSGVTGYQTFSGTSYATSAVDRTYYLANSTQFGEPGTGFSVDEIFNPITGQLAANKIISLVTGKQDGLVGDIILHSQGNITTRNDYGLVGYWHLDEGVATTTYDASGVGNNGITSSTTWLSGTNCKAGACLSFDGSSSFVDVGTGSGVNGNLSAMSIMAWVDPSAFQADPDQSTIFTKANAYYFQLNSSGQLAAYMYGVSPPGYYFSNGTVSLGNWSFVALTYNGASVKFYINGSLDTASSTSGGSIGTSASHVGIGANLNSAGSLYVGYPRRFKGLIDEVRIYNRALSATEILNQYDDIK